MSDSAFVQEWPENKLTVAELRAVTPILLEYQDGIDEPDPTFAAAAHKMKAALDKAEGKGRDRDCMREFRIREANIGSAVTDGAQDFALRVYFDSEPEINEVITVIDPEAWRLEAKVVDIVTPADFESVGQVELQLEPTGAAVKGRFAECDNAVHPTGWKWVP